MVYKISNVKVYNSDEDLIPKQVNEIKQSYYSKDTVFQWDEESEKHITNLVRRIVANFDNKKEINVIDIGSNTGKFLEMLDKNIKVVNALLIEPEKDLLEFSKTKFDGRGFSFLEIALSNKVDRIFWSRASREGNNLGLSRITNNPECESINAYTFDSLEFNEFTPDLIKIDAEGSDFKIILGMLEFLKSLKDKPLIVAETNGWKSISPENAIDLLKIQHILSNIGYNFETLPENSTDLFFY